jgi:hypothetical protein
MQHYYNSVGAALLLHYNCNTITVWAVHCMHSTAQRHCAPAMLGEFIAACKVLCYQLTHKRTDLYVNQLQAAERDKSLQQLATKKAEVSATIHIALLVKRYWH